MLKTRVIPCLLLKGQGLVKTTKFKDPVYVGDPINAVRIFNEKEVDELALLDITATREGRAPSFKLIGEIASECFMPLAYGGGIRTIDDMRELFHTGVEKLIINTLAFRRPEALAQAAREFGSQSIVVSIDVRKSLLSRYEVYSDGGTRGTGLDPVKHARDVEALGVGEILLNAIDRDGTMSGYDIALVRRVCDAVSIPVIACGGAARLSDFRLAVDDGHASAVAAGSLFVFHGRHRAVLITYPSQAELGSTFAPGTRSS